MAVTSTGDSGDNLFGVDSNTPTTASVTGGLGEDTIQVGLEFGNITDATVFGGEGVSSPNDGDDTILVQSLAALVYGNGGDDSIVVEVEDATTVYGGLADDTIEVDSFDGASVLVFGGENNDSITVDSEDGDVTVYGGTGVSDPLDGDDTIVIGDDGGEPDTALIYGNGGDDSIELYVSESATVYGGAGDDTIIAETSEDQSVDVLIYGGSEDDSIRVTLDSSLDEDAGGVTIYGGEGITDPTDGDDTIVVDNAATFTVYGNGGGDSIDVDAYVSGLVHGGVGNDTIEIDDEGADGASLTAYGDEGADLITTDFIPDSDVTIYGGTGVSDPDDEGDTIQVGVFDGEPGPFDAPDTALVYGNGGDDDIDVAVTESAQVYGGADDDTIDVTQFDVDNDFDDETDPVGDVSVFGGAGEDEIRVETDSAEATVSGGETLDATQNTSRGEDLFIQHRTANETDDGGAPVASQFLLVGSIGDDFLGFVGVTGDEVEIRLGGDTDDVQIGVNNDSFLNFTVDDGELDAADLEARGATDVEYDEVNTVTFTFNDVDVTLVGITQFNAAPDAEPPLVD